MSKSLSHIFPFVVSMALAGFLSSCFTGIESTKRIELSKEDLRDLSPSPEELLMAEVKGVPLQEWAVGKEFIVADPKLSFLLRGETGSADISLKTGEILRFSGVTSVPVPDGSVNCGLIFRDPRGASLLMNSSRSMEGSGSELFSDRLPMLRDCDMISRTDSLLKGKILWSRSHLVYDKDGMRLETMKFTPLMVDSVTQGDANFPLRVWTTDSAGGSRFYYMGFNGSGADSRPMSRIFSLSDPRLAYPNLSESHWNAIKRRLVVPGMTKDECRLSLGSPADATAGRNYSSTLDLWQYPDGTYLRFVDGLLVDFRK